MTPKIIVIGSSNTDMICRVPHIPKPGETVLGSTFSTVPGGKGANQAVAAARAGGAVTFVACVGNDAFGKSAIEAYKQEALDTSCITVIDGIASGVALINVADTGENSISVSPGANAYLTPEVIEKYSLRIRESDVILLQLEIPIETVNYVVRLAHSEGRTIILNPAPAMTIDPDILGMISVITPNEHEAALLTGSEGNHVEEMALKLYDKGVENVVITRGARGAYCLTRGGFAYVRGINVRSIDTTAAGDTFNGYLAVELSKGVSIEEALVVANKAAAISVTRMGAQPSIPFINELI